jgi:hypothetical protein
MSGISLRSAISLGLNLRVAHSTISDIPSEIRIGVWWSLWTLGQTLNLMTDRNAEVDLSICNIPLPRPLFEGGFDGGNHRQGLEGQSTISVTCQVLHGSLHTQSRPLLRVRLLLNPRSRQPMTPTSIISISNYF